jgi:hypothetical protein
VGCLQNLGNIKSPNQNLSLSLSHNKELQFPLRSEKLEPKGRELDDNFTGKENSGEASKS